MTHGAPASRQPPGHDFRSPLQHGQCPVRKPGSRVDGASRKWGTGQSWRLVASTGVLTVNARAAPGGSDRRLLAVVHLDMVGYSRLIGLDDVGTVTKFGPCVAN